MNLKMSGVSKKLTAVWKQLSANYKSCHALNHSKETPATHPCHVAETFLLWSPTVLRDTRSTLKTNSSRCVLHLLTANTFPHWASVSEFVSVQTSSLVSQFNRLSGEDVVSMGQLQNNESLKRASAGRV